MVKIERRSIVKKKIKDLKQAIALEIREHKSTFIVYTILRLFVILVAVLQFFNKNYENVFLCLLTLILFTVPSFLQIKFKIELPTTLEIIILLFIFAAEILGEIQSFYLLFPFWDTLLHTLNGFLAAAIGFSLVELVNNEERLMFKLSPLFMSIVAFAFSMTIGVCWEIFEYMMDCIFMFDMQKDTIIHSISSVTLDPTLSNIPVIINDIKDVYINGVSMGIEGYLDIGLIDTMNDLIVNFIGAIFFSAFGYIYTKNKGKGKFVSRFIPFRKLKKKESI